MSDQPQTLPPPLELSYPVAPARLAWPAVVGILSIIWALLGLTLLVSVATGKPFFPLQYMTRSSHDWQIVAGVMRLFLHLMLLMAAICLLNRLALAGPMHLVVGAVYLAIGAIDISADSPFFLCLGPSTPGDLRLVAAVAIANFAGAISYPVFLVVWFSRRKIRRQLREGAVTAAPRPRWAIPIGLISLAWGSLRVLEVSSSYLLMMHHGASFRIHHAVLDRFFLPVLLIVAGILLLRGRPLATPLHVVFAWLTVIYSLSVCGYHAVQWSLTAGKATGTVELIAIVGTNLLTVSYPVFLLIWFSRRKIKTDLQAMRR